jgi:regulator of sigma E protease
MSILIFFVVLFVLILVHEWGHFIVAKKTGMRVDEFGIGFPPKLYGVQKGETEYTLNALPIGGFVRIFGENLEGVEEGESDKKRAFGNRPKWAQALVLIAGVTMNVIFAWFLFFVVLLIEEPKNVEESAASPEAVLYATSVMAEGPLNEKLPAGSEIIKLTSGGEELVNPIPTTFTNFIQAHANNLVEIHYRYGENDSVVSVEPVTGLIPDAKERAAVGISLSLMETKRASLGEAIVEATKMTYTSLINITIGLFAFISQAFQGTADFSQVAGPIGLIGLVGDAATIGFTTLLTFTAIISLHLAVINMLPIPALDGGRLVFVAIEAVTRRPINPVWAGRVNLVGFALLMLLMVVVTWNDIVRLF